MLELTKLTEMTFQRSARFDNERKSSINKNQKSDRKTNIWTTTQCINWARTFNSAKAFGNVLKSDTQQMWQKQTFIAAPKNDVTARVMPNAVDISWPPGTAPNPKPLLPPACDWSNGCYNDKKFIRKSVLQHFLSNYITP